MRTRLIRRDLRRVMEARAHLLRGRLDHRLHEIWAAVGQSWKYLSPDAQAAIEGAFGALIPSLAQCMACIGVLQHELSARQSLESRARGQGRRRKLRTPADANRWIKSPPHKQVCVMRRSDGTLTVDGGCR